MASTGGVRAAYRAGRRAPTKVTSRPMTTAWNSTVANTDAGEAPTARRRANSFWRWRTLMAKVFMMMNEPTNIARTTKTSRKVWT